MDCDIPRWLKQELQLIHMSETDLNTLMFNPRHGTLCRRLVKFLAESTLCEQKYPNVYANEQYLEAASDLTKVRKNLRDAIKKLENFVRDNENEERESVFLISRLDHLRNIEDLLRVTNDALERIVNRPNFKIEQVKRNLEEEINYISNSDLENIYSTDKKVEIESSVSARQMAAVDEELSDLIKKINSLNDAITKLLYAITEKMDDVEGDLELKMADMDDLAALKVCEPEEIIVEVDKGEKELKDKNIELSKKVFELNQQVTELKNQYNSGRAEIIQPYKVELERCLLELEKMQELENLTKDRSSSG